MKWFPEDINFVLKKMFQDCGTRDVGDIFDAQPSYCEHQNLTAYS